MTQSLVHPKKHLYQSIVLILFMVTAGCRKAPIGAKFALLSPDETGIYFSNNIPQETPDGMNIIQYLYYYNGGGVAAGDLNNDGLTDLFFTSNLENNRLYFNKGEFKFDDVSEPAGITGSKGCWKTGVSLVDINADGWLDIYVCCVGKYKKWSGRNQLFVNNHNGTFTDQATAYGLDIAAFATQANFFDADNDGDLDCFLLCHSVHSAGSYRDTSQTRQKDPLAADRLLLCETKGKATVYRDVSAEWGIYGGTAGYGLGMVAGDMNGDHYTDLYVANDFHENDYLYINQKGKGFKESIAGFAGHTSNFSMGCDMADYNNDALPDLISLDMKPEDETLAKASQPADLYEINHYKHNIGYHWQYPRNALQLNQSANSEQFITSEIAYFAGVAATDWSWSALFTDLDLDGWKDLYITNGIVRRPNNMDYIRFTSTEEMQRSATDKQILEKMPDGAAANYCFRNTSYLDFQDKSAAWGLDQKGYSNGAIYADLDNDGDVDLVTNNINQPASVWNNTTITAAPQLPQPAYLKIKLTGNAANTYAIGAKIWAYSKDTLQYFENQPVRGFQSCVEPGIIYVGLGTAMQMDSLLVRWPDGTQTRQTQVKANQTLNLNQNNSQPGIWVNNDTPAKTADQIITTSFPFQEAENLPEKLQPWSLTNNGPKPAINHQMLFLPGENGGDLYLWLNNGKAYKVQSIPYPGKGVCAIFFDANGDGKDDLFVGTAPNIANPMGIDWLFIQQNGLFVPASELPGSPSNTSCASACDMDGDGDQDLFIGGRSQPGNYGVVPKSYLLQNNGKAQFTDITDAKAPQLSRLGMITDAVWADINKNGEPDLVLCGEWMGIHIFFNEKGVLAGTAIPESSGLWNKMVAADFDHDGDIDLMGGNFGTNSILTASRAQPLELWSKDFDHNMQSDPVMAYYRNGKKYVWADKDLLLSQLPFLKKRYISYNTYAHHTFDEVFTDDLQEDAKVWKVEQLRSSFFEQKNEGLWRITPLADPIQWAPVFAIAAGNLDNSDGMDALVGGNFYDISPAIGRLDALPITNLMAIGSGQFMPIPTSFQVNAAIRDIQFTPDQKHIVVTTDHGIVYLLNL